MPQLVPVTPDNFIRAESDLMFSGLAKDAGGIGKFVHHREAIGPGFLVVRPNRDTLYSAGIFDLDAGPVTIAMPDAGQRLMSLMATDEDHYCLGVYYGAGEHAFTRAQIGTRYVALGVRTFVDPNNRADVRAVHALQDAIKLSQPGGPGKLEIPAWDRASQDKVRGALLELGETKGDFTHTFGAKGDVDPVHHLIGTATGFGGTPERDATYVGVTPRRNDGRTPYALNVGDVPVDGFWSVTVYDKQGGLIANSYDAYSFNNITAARDPDGSVTIHFGGSDQASNFLPIEPGWNYLVRLYRPRPDILEGRWKFPAAQPLQ